MKKRTSATRKRIKGHLEQVNLYAAGIDIGSTSHYVAVPPELDEKPVREFGCFTGDLNRLADWLVAIGIRSVAMESTGVYWIPVYEILEERGLEVLLVNARHVKNVPGRKTDVRDCQWLQELHTYGLLSGAFRPPEETLPLRAYMRQRENLVSRSADHIRQMQKALRQMNLLLDNVVSDITGVTGMAILRAILDGERDPRRLAEHRDKRCQKDQQTIAASLEGHYRAEHVFALRQAVESYDFCQQQMTACDAAIEQQLKQLEPKDPQAPKDGGSGDVPGPARRGRSKNGMGFDVRGELSRRLGVDLTRIDGMSDTTVLKVLAETGSDMRFWATEKHFVSWLGLCPGNRITGGKVLSSQTKRCANRAAAAFRMSAYALSNAKSALGAYYRRMRAKHGAPKAITATAHKLARIFYSMLKHGTEFVDRGQNAYEEEYRGRVVKNLTRRAKELGFSLVPNEEKSDSINPELSMA